MCLGMYTFLASHLYSVKTLPYQLKEKKIKAQAGFPPICEKPKAEAEISSICGTK